MTITPDIKKILSIPYKPAETAAEYRKRKRGNRKANKLKKMNHVKPPVIIRNDLVDKRNFYSSWEWKAVRLEVLLKYGRRCQCCGATSQDSKIVVDHIKPLREYWDLRLSINNLQVLCEDCNMGKSNTIIIDFRPNASL